LKNVVEPPWILIYVNFSLYIIEGEKVSEPADFVGYCGLYCNACGIRQGKIKEAVQNLRKVMGAYGFDKIMPELAEWEPSFKHYGEFEQVLTGLVNLFGDCPGCYAGGGDPGCKVRRCAQQRGYKTCAECPDVQECEKILEHVKGDPTRRAVLEEIKEMGPEKWAEKMQEKGFSYLQT